MGNPPSLNKKSQNVSGPVESKNRNIGKKRKPYGRGGAGNVYDERNKLSLKVRNNLRTFPVGLSPFLSSCLSPSPYTPPGHQQ